MLALSTQEVQKLHPGNIALCPPRKYTRNSEGTMTFGDQVKERRETRGMSLDDLAELSGFSKSYIHRIEQNRVHPTSGAVPQPSRRFVEAIAPALDWPQSEALKAAGYVVQETTSDYDTGDARLPRLIAFYDDLPADDRDDLLALAEAKWKRRRAQEKTLGVKPE